MRRLDSALRWTLATASGVAVANMYYNQPMLADIGREFHTSARHVGLVATATQVGYAVGMPLFIPLGDFVNRRTRSSPCSGRSPARSPARLWRRTWLP